MRRARLIEATARRPGESGTHTPCPRVLALWQMPSATTAPVVMDPGSRFEWPGRRYFLALLHPSAQLFRPPCDSSTNTTGVPFLILLPSKPASQFVSRTQPWDSDLLTFEGLGVPWMPYPSAVSPIQYDPTGLFGPGLIVNACLDLTPLNL